MQSLPWRAVVDYFKIYISQLSSSPGIHTQDQTRPKNSFCSRIQKMFLFGKEFGNRRRCRATVGDVYHLIFVPVSLMTWFNTRGYRPSGLIKGTICTPVTGRAGPEGSRELRLLDFLTTAQYGGRLSASRTGRLYPQEYSWYSFSLGLSRPQGHGLVGRKCITEKSSDTTGNRSRDSPTSSAAP